jgi:hypothetical protein
MLSNRPKFGFIDGTLIYNAWDNDFEIIRSGRFNELFTEQLIDENIKTSELCIFDCTNEGIGTSDIDDMVDAIKNDYPNLEIRVLFNIPTTKKLNYRYNCFPEHMVAHYDFVSHINSLDVKWESLDITKHFISLQRRASVGRLKFTKQLLDNFDKDQYILSCGSQPNKWLNELTNLKEAIHPYKLPILIDGVVDTDNKQHYHHDNDFFRCMVNVIAETSSQTDDSSWREVFLTEKTFKAFAYRQIPIWFSVPNTVNEVRKLGFDVFDDIIDHSYDIIEDEDVRRNTVVSELNKFCTAYPMSELNELRTSIWKRISNNMILLRNLKSTHIITKYNHILDLIKNEF